MTTCPHGELDAVCRACCDPLTVTPGDWEPGHVTPVGGWIVVALLGLLVLAAIAWRITR